MDAKRINEAINKVVRAQIDAVGLIAEIVMENGGSIAVDMTLDLPRGDELEHAHIETIRLGEKEYEIWMVGEDGYCYDLEMSDAIFVLDELLRIDKEKEEELFV